MPKGGRRRRKKKGKKKKKDKGGAQRSKRDASADVEEKEDASAVARVFNDVALADAIMSYYFVAKPRGATEISALAMADRYWYSCHEDFVVRYPEALLCAWFESCCGRDGLFVFNRTNRAQRLYLTLEETQDSSVAHLLRGCGATCFGAGGKDDEDDEDDSNVHVMSLLNIFATPSLRENNTVLSFAKHMMSQWMYLSIGDWKVEMRNVKTFKKNLVEMCVGWEKAKRGGCRPSGVALSRAKMLVSLALAFEVGNAPEAERIVEKLKL